MVPTSQTQSQPVTALKDPWYAPLNRVTVLSKVIAVIVFITLPFVGFWVGYNYTPREEVLPIERLATPDALPEPLSPTGLESVVVSTTTTSASGSVISGTFYPKPIPVAGAVMLPADESTETINMGEYLVRYTKEAPKILQVLYPHDREPFVTQVVEWNFPAQIINNTGRNGYDERVLVGRDFNYDGYTDIGLMVWFYRGHNKYDLFTFNPYTFNLEPLVVEGVNESFSSPTFDVRNRTMTLYDGQPDISTDGSVVSSYSQTTYKFDGEKYVEVDGEVLD
jgi:hypothetical protein